MTQELILTGRDFEQKPRQLPETSTEIVVQLRTHKLWTVNWKIYQLGELK